MCGRFTTNEWYNTLAVSSTISENMGAVCQNCRLRNSCLYFTWYSVMISIFTDWLFMWKMFEIYVFSDSSKNSEDVFTNKFFKINSFKILLYRFGYEMFHHFNISAEQLQ